ncbi:hypothetical protein J5N97_004868 [Dioscorea zingiberensis]|uniref:W2 domain-containing protein n=1 Tax=Dioscorea zingiberensis TaxID=325984 RepID=A0A9D5D8T5_9LILI|nr:hypothetical protein J5N97_004868 [Dioscorea zingiberensis]
MKKKGVVARKEGTAPKGTTTKKKATGSDEEHSSPVGSQIGDNEVAEDDDDDDNDIQWQADTSLEAARQRIEEQLSAVTAEMVMLSSTTKPDQEEKPKKEPKCEARNNGEDIAPKKPVTPGNLVKVIKDNFEKGCTPSEIGSFLTPLTATPQEVMVALFDFLFEGVGKGFAKEVGKKKNYLAAAMTDEGSQMLLLHSIEAFCGKCNAEAVKEVALVTKFLYDEDLLDEETIMLWYNEGLAGANKSSHVWRNIKPFVEWLQSAESETEE